MNDDTTDSAVVLKMKLAADERNFLGRPRPRLTGPVGTIGSAVGSKCSIVGSIDGSIDGSISDSVGEGGNSSLAWSF